MSARGARSRKVQQKDTEKKEKKVAVQGKAPEVHDAFADWRATPSSNGPRNAGAGLTRSVSNLSRGTSRSSGTNGSGNRSRLNTTYSNESSSHGGPSKSSTSGAASVSDHSARGQDKAKFQANGKKTTAPRGRGGGVPIKTTVTPTPEPTLFQSESPAPRLASHRRTWLDFMIWEGGKEEMRPYGGFAFDEDMHSGSVLIYFKEEQLDEAHPVPSIRAELEVIQSSGSSWLSNALLMGCLDEDEDDWASTAADELMAPSRQYAHDRRMLGPISLGGMSPPPLDIDRVSSRAPSRSASLAPQTYSNDRARSPLSGHLRQNSQQNPTHEIWFTAPSELRTVQAQRLHHVAIRNFLAILHGKPIVGADVFDMLSTLQMQIQVMYDLDTDTRSTTPAERSVQMITNYLGQYGIDNVCKDTRHALALLAWAEQDSVRWRKGYLECFTHLAGAMTPRMEETSGFKRLSITTRRNLGIAAKTLQLRVMEAEERLGTFDFADLWKDSPKLTNGPVHQSYQGFRQFLIDHYGRIYGTWPPPSEGLWLNRKAVLAMQDDFGSLYDYLVDRDVYWNPREERASRKWEMQHRLTDDFEADLPELGITDMLVMYDAKAGYAHIPHPYPLLPREVSKLPKPKEKKSFFSSLKKDKTKDATKDAKAHLQLSIVFSDATNIEKLDVNFNGSTLIDKFEQFELTTDLKNISPREARLGRWVLLYGILQVLSTLSVDVQGLKHTEGVRYFLCTDLKRCPEWVTSGQSDSLEATQQRSWCWQRAWDPTPIRNAPVELEAAAMPDRSSAPRDRARSNTQTRNVEYTSNSTPPPQRPLPAAPLDFKGATLMQNDIARISEKIDSLSMSHNASRMLRQEYERRRENEKVMAGEFKSPRINDVGVDYRHLRTEESHRLAESEYASRPLPPIGGNMERDNHREIYANRPLAPPRGLSRGPMSSSMDLGGYPFSAAEMDFPSPPGYSVGTRERSGSRPPRYGNEVMAGQGRERSASRLPGYEEPGVRRERVVYGRSGWQ
ncbi:uncharacterized protein M421DRAFT_414920 [Didymella exigua CBS 183.55]|uniref:DUF8004 domain-containing protein n=1 Tax=Didymella exigua CBS 183.55 TaxID=1150837 RepID=A0A6A5S298_9PLEO|nr:uncharacterized protein M421DRAFT_414920 [Didymella exigua CBS 183.55]KAF1933869.1 hypothetical protein M421DRAFT_414920 [Didymella exigua CBS 183.55]